MENNPVLGDVDLSGNKIESLQGMPTDTIHTLNLSQNQIADVVQNSKKIQRTEIIFECRNSGMKLLICILSRILSQVSELAQGFQGLVTLDLTENPVGESVDDLKTEALIMLDYQLSQFNSEEVLTFRLQ